MHIKTLETRTGRTVAIRAGERLDWRIHTIFSQAASLVSDTASTCSGIEIDLRKTRLIRDSGLSMLNMLSKKSGLPRTQIRLVNCSPEIRARLYASGLAGSVEVS